jgi:hypothetical protein
MERRRQTRERDDTLGEEGGDGADGGGALELVASGSLGGRISLAQKGQ